MSEAPIASLSDALPVSTPVKRLARRSGTRRYLSFSRVSPRVAAHSGSRVSSASNRFACRQLACLGILLTALCGCVEHGAQPLQPLPDAPVPADELWPGPMEMGNNVYSDGGFDVAGGSLSLQVQRESGVLPGARVHVYGATLASGVTNARGEVTFAPLAEGDAYRVVVEADTLASAVLDNLTISRKTPLRRVLTMVAEQRVTGRVTDGQSGIPNALISDGLNTATSDDTGAFLLRGVSQGKVSLFASAANKTPIVVTAELINGQNGLRDLILSSSNRDVYLDPASLSGAPRPQFTRMQAFLREEGYRIISDAPTRGGVWLLFAPEVMPSTAQMLAFVRAGGRLIICGEWGGYSGLRIRELNGLAHGFGLHFNTDLVRYLDNAGSQKAEWLSVRNLRPGSPVTLGVEALNLYQSGSLFGISPIQSLALSPTRTLRIQSTRTPATHHVVMGGAFGAGRVAALADASMWSDDDTDGNGTINFLEAGNRRLLKNLLNW